jgi:hypothetical protein
MARNTSSEEQAFLEALNKKLWNSADRLRASLDAAVYKGDPQEPGRPGFWGRILRYQFGTSKARASRFVDALRSQFVTLNRKGDADA